MAPRLKRRTNRNPRGRWRNRKPRVKPEDRKIAEVKGPFECYLLRSTNPAYPKTTYVGASGRCPFKRLESMHNKGKVKRTSQHGPWEIVAVVRGFRTWHEALQFEWRWHKECSGCTRWSKGVEAAMRALERTLASEQWTSRSPLSVEVPLTVTSYPDGQQVYPRAPPRNAVPVAPAPGPATVRVAPAARNAAAPASAVAVPAARAAPAVIRPLNKNPAAERLRGQVK